MLLPLCLSLSLSLSLPHTHLNIFNQFFLLSNRFLPLSFHIFTLSPTHRWVIKPLSLPHKHAVSHSFSHIIPILVTPIYFTYRHTYIIHYFSIKTEPFSLLNNSFTPLHTQRVFLILTHIHSISFLPIHNSLNIRHFPCSFIILSRTFFISCRHISFIL